MKIIVATQEEFELARKYLPEFPIVQTGVGAKSVIGTLANIDPHEDFINIGFAGSNTLPKGTVTLVGRSYLNLQPYMVGLVNDEYTEGIELSEEGIDCYTDNNFVQKSTNQSPVLYDMELYYELAFPFRIVGSIKIVSDNLSYSEYDKTVQLDNPEIWEKVKELLYKLLNNL